MTHLTVVVAPPKTLPLAARHIVACPNVIQAVMLVEDEALQSVLSPTDAQGLHELGWDLGLPRFKSIFPCPGPEPVHVDDEVFGQDFEVGHHDLGGLLLALVAGSLRCLLLHEIIQAD